MTSGLIKTIAAWLLFLLDLLVMTSRKKRITPTRTENVPVTQAMLYLVRDELKSHIISHEGQFDSVHKRFDSIDKKFEFSDSQFKSIDERFASIDRRFESIDKRFESIDKRFDAIDKRFDAIDKRFDSLELKIESLFSKMDAKLDKMYAEIHSVKLLCEEQNSRNKFVMDGYTSVYYRCEENEKRINEVENDFQKLLRARNNEPMPK